jgi:hypothetical protein
MKELPKFLIADSSEQPDAVYVIHTAYPRFCINVADDHIFWMEEFDEEDDNELQDVAEALVAEALDFFDSEMESLD